MDGFIDKVIVIYLNHYGAVHVQNYIKATGRSHNSHIFHK